MTSKRIPRHHFRVQYGERVPIYEGLLYVLCVANRRHKKVPFMEIPQELVVTNATITDISNSTISWMYTGGYLAYMVIITAMIGVVLISVAVTITVMLIKICKNKDKYSRVNG